MKRGLLLAAVLLTWGCKGSRPEAPAPPPLTPEANLEVVIHEAVERPDEEGTAYAQVFIDGTLLGQTPAGPKSTEKIWRGHVAPGNRLLRLEYWVLPGLGSWERLPDDRQPRERFVRVENGHKTAVQVRFFDKTRRNTLQVLRVE